MMKTAKPRHGDHAICSEILRRLTPSRSTLLQRKVRPVIMVITDVFGHQSLQVSLVQNDDMIQQVSSTVSNPALDDTVLPRTAKARAFELNAEALDCGDNLRADL